MSRPVKIRLRRHSDPRPGSGWAAQFTGEDGTVHLIVGSTGLDAIVKLIDFVPELARELRVLVADGKD